MISQYHGVKGSLDLEYKPIKMSYHPEYKPIKMSYHPAKFGVHSQSGCGVIINLVCHVILQDHVIKCLCDL